MRNAILYKRQPALPPAFLGATNAQALPLVGYGRWQVDSSQVMQIEAQREEYHRMSKAGYFIKICLVENKSDVVATIPQNRFVTSKKIATEILKNPNDQRTKDYE